MPLDGLTLHSLVKQLDTDLKNGRIMKIYQPDRYTVVLHVRLPGHNAQLVLSADPEYPRIHTTAADRENPLSPPAFCMLLRKYLEPSRILKLEQRGLDRVVAVHLESMAFTGSAGQLQLILEIMGRQSNVVLVTGDGVILDALKRTAPQEGKSGRTLMPGEAYEFPPDQGKKDPRLTSGAEVETELRLALPQQPLWKVLQNSLQGLSRLAAQEIVSRAGLSPDALRAESGDEDWQRIAQAVQEVVAEAASGGPAYYLPLDGGDFAGYRVTHHPCREYPNIAELVDDFYTQRVEQAELNQLRASLRRALDKHLARVVKKAELQQEALRSAEHAHTWRKLGELITANLHLIAPGSAAAEVVDYSDPALPTVTVQLDPALTPIENAQAMFKKYQKAKKSLDITREQLEKTEAEREYLEAALTYVELAEDLATLQEIQMELEREGYLKAQKRRAAAPMQLSPERYQLPDGSEILVGRNNRQNDILTFKIAGPDDLWFHAQKMPGSHVVLRPAGEPSPEAIRAAAVLAARHSQGKEATKVPVDYTHRRYVRKPAGAKPGFVLYERYQTIMVDPQAGLPGLTKAQR